MSIDNKNKEINENVQTSAETSAEEVNAVTEAEQTSEETKTETEDKQTSEETKTETEDKQTSEEAKPDTKTVKKKKAQKKKGGLKKFFKSRKAKHGTIAVAIVAVVIALTILLNVICNLLVERFPALSFDLTSNQVFALQDDTSDYVSHLDKDVTIYVLADEDSFVANGKYFVQAEKFLNSMEDLSEHIKIKYVDVSKNPTFTSNYNNIDWSISTHVFLVECGEEYRVLDIKDCFEYDEESYYYYGTMDITSSTVEQAIVTAMLNVTTDNKIVVDIISGNSEQDSTSIKELLENNAYQTNEVNLTTSDLDEDAKVAFLFAPSVDLDAPAIEKLEKWLNNSGDYGKSLIYVANYDVESTPNLDIFLEKWGIKMSDGIIFETDPNYLVSNTYLVSLTNYNEIFTEDLKNNSIPVISSYARGVEVTDTELATPVLTTSNSAGILPYSEKSNTEWDYRSAITGDPLNVAAMGTQANTDSVESNVVVFGSFEMFSNSIMSYNSYNNSAFLVNAVNTLADRDNIGITIESKSMDTANLGIDLAGQNALMILFVIIVPIAVLVAGLVIWIRRRNK